MTRGVIRLGDATSHGGQVTSTGIDGVVMGKPMARKGDTCSCPLHGMCTIVEGHVSVQLGGTAVAFEGHRTSCGATLISTVSHAGLA
jgi:uncharacterized Zn-binding protein involved in type VI secretion